LVSKVVKNYTSLEDAVSALKDIPPYDLSSGVKYLEELLAKNTVEKPDSPVKLKISNTY